MDTYPMQADPVWTAFPPRTQARSARPDLAPVPWLDRPAERTPPPPAAVTSGADASASTATTRCGELVGESACMRSVFQQIRRVAPSELTVLLEGESGTGKELAAQAIHALSGRQGAFVAINCGAVAPELLASVLFGHERGSFTGAVNEHRGLFEQAGHGTLFLDEVTEMPYALQAHLLRALESGAIRRIGSQRERKVDCRVIAATNRDSRSAMRDGALREDLYYRLSDYPLRLPPLRERPEDIFLLAQYFLAGLNSRHGTARYFARDAEIKLLGHAWPGNVRELKQIVGRAYLLGDDDALRVELPGRPPLGQAERAGSVAFRVGMSFEEVEQRMLRETLRYFDNDKARAAAALGISLKTIYNRLARCGAEGLAVNSRQGMAPV